MKQFGNLAVVIALMLGAIQIGGCAAAFDDTSAREAEGNRLATTIKTQLFEQLGIVANVIAVESNSDSVTLEGFVENEQQRSAAQEIAQAAAGQRSVENRIEVK